jgi:hypothetical protein
VRGKGLTAGPIAPSKVELMIAAAVTEPPVQGTFCVASSPKTESSAERE